MAKRTSTRSTAHDSGAAAVPDQPKTRRTRAAAAPPALQADMSATQPSAPSEEEIRLRAYHRYVERGGSHGMDFEDWLEAERELKSKPEV